VAEAEAAGVAANAQDAMCPRPSLEELLEAIRDSDAVRPPRLAAPWSSPRSIHCPNLPPLHSVSTCSLYIVGSQRPPLTRQRVHDVATEQLGIS